MVLQRATSCPLLCKTPLGAKCCARLEKFLGFFWARRGLERDSGPPGWKSAEVSLRTCWLGDFVGLIEDRGGSDLHNNRICPWLHSVIAQLLLFAINKERNDAALDRNIDYPLFDRDFNDRLCGGRCG